MMLALAAMVADAQDFREKYEQFKQKATQTYNDFRAEANAKYCEFLKGAWEWYEQMPVVKSQRMRLCHLWFCQKTTNRSL